MDADELLGFCAGIIQYVRGLDDDVCDLGHSGQRQKERLRKLRQGRCVASLLAAVVAAASLFASL